MATDPSMDNELTPRLPVPGFHRLRILSTNVLELTLINTKAPDPASVDSWNFVNGSGNFTAPPVSAFVVTVNGTQIPVRAVGFKRRPLYAPLAKRDLRISNCLYLMLARPLDLSALAQTVEVRNPTSDLWPASMQFTAVNDPLRYSPVIHANQAGYTRGLPKRATIGYFLGSLGELDISPLVNFNLVDANSGAVVFAGPLMIRLDQGYTYTPTPYQRVLQADFSSVNTPGEYRLVVPGLGASMPFFINDGIAMGFARSYALGLYHQRCGTNNVLPFTRHTHDSCHTNLAQVPDMRFTNTQKFLALVSSDYTNEPRHTAPQLSNVDASLYPFIRRFPVDVSGGHHDAGDYSKYTINSAALVHYLVFAADAFVGVGNLDNLGLPESGDGKSDLLEEAKWEADFLAKMQDDDGGFYFLVYPRDRQYESNVLPDHGDPQVVWPKNTAATAAAVAALAQCSSSPRFKDQFPEEAMLYRQKALKGWTFLTNAIARFGKDGSYQKLTHYGNDFLHNDEIAWAACELFLATGDQYFHQQLKTWFPNPADPATQRWGWWRLFASYGCTIRSYAFAVRTGRLSATQIDPVYLDACETQIRACADDHVTFARNNAYGTSFPTETKRVRGAGWYFSNERAFDITVACQLEVRLEWIDAILSNLNYEAGGNPVNICYVTGLGWNRQREIVHQYAQNDERVMPPSGLPLGNIQASFDYLANYKSELGALCFPADGSFSTPYPYYDRWGDSFNVSTEFVVTDQARSLASMAWLAAQTPAAGQFWQSADAQITGLPVAAMTNTTVTATLNVPGLSMQNVRIIWEAKDQEPAYGASFVFKPVGYGPQWVEAEAVWPDGRRAFARTSFVATNTLPTVGVLASVPIASEQGPVAGEFTVSRSGYTNSSLTVFYQLGGTALKFTDYRRPQGDMPEFVVIPAGAYSATITIVPVNDNRFEGFETATLTLSANASYNVGTAGSATVTIADNDLGILGLVFSTEGDSTLTWVSVPGLRYRVVCTDTLENPNWRDVSGDIVAIGNMTSWSDVVTVPRSQCFYRIRLVP